MPQLGMDFNHRAHIILRSLKHPISFLVEPELSRFSCPLRQSSTSHPAAQRRLVMVENKKGTYRMGPPFDSVRWPYKWLKMVDMGLQLLWVFSWFINLISREHHPVWGFLKWGYPNNGLFIKGDWALVQYTLDPDDTPL